MLTKKLTLALLIGGLTLSGATFAADKTAAESAISAAKAAQKEAAQAGGEWRDTGKMIESAEKAASEGNFATAVKLADAAKDQGMLGKEQAMGQKDVGNPEYLYN